MSTELQTKEIDSAILSSVVLKGDLSGLNEQQKVVYYRQFCERLGLDPLSQPFKLLRLSGKEVLYCDRSGAAQLNKLYKVSHAIISRELVGDIFIVTARASTASNSTESIGALNVKGLSGESLANAYMKAETKAKRRSTLDLLGLGMLDETETETIAGAQTAEVIERSADEIRAFVDGATTKKELNGIYIHNKKVVDSDEGLQQYFKDKQAAIDNPNNVELS